MPESMEAAGLANEKAALQQQVNDLRTALAYEASVVLAQSSGAKTLGKGRIAHLHASAERMRATARGEYPYSGVNYLSLIRARKDAEAGEVDR